MNASIKVPNIFNYTGVSIVFSVDTTYASIYINKSGYVTRITECPEVVAVGKIHKSNIG